VFRRVASRTEAPAQPSREDRTHSVRSKVAATYLVLIAANVSAWFWALATFHKFPVAMGTAVLAYTLGLRHAIDADHIAAIDNVTRKLMQQGERPVGVGLFFSLGHSTVVILASVAIAVTTNGLKGRFAVMRDVGGIIGTLVSALFLLLIAVINLFVLVSVYRTFQHARRKGTYVATDLNALLAGGGLLARILRPLFKLIDRSWHMYPLGFLFGLGFDTATEVGLLGISAVAASKGMGIWSILIFPALFTAGMSLVDTTDGVLMLGAYGWAFAKPVRKLYYNMTVTLVSVVVALLVGGIEVLGLLAEHYRFRGAFWDTVAVFSHNFGTVGALIIGVFVASLIVSVAFYFAKGYDTLEMRELAGD
jgi:nickel/cobalt transporter (NiCoT) family protein